MTSRPFLRSPRLRGRRRRGFAPLSFGVQAARSCRAPASAARLAPHARVSTAYNIFGRHPRHGARKRIGRARERSPRVCKAWARVPAGIANARARSVAAPIANREPQKSTAEGRKCGQFFSEERAGGPAHQVPSTARSNGCPSRRDRAALRGQLIERGLAIDLSGRIEIEIDCPQVACRTRRRTDHGVGILLPPREDLRLVPGRIFETVGAERLLVDWIAWKDRD